MVRVRITTLALLFFLTDAPAALAQRVGTIEGQVRSETGQLISIPVRVRLEAANGVVLSDQNTDGDDL